MPPDDALENRVEKRCLRASTAGRQRARFACRLPPARRSQGRRGLRSKAGKQKGQCRKCGHAPLNCRSEAKPGPQFFKDLLRAVRQEIVADRTRGKILAQARTSRTTL